MGVLMAMDRVRISIHGYGSSAHLAWKRPGARTPSANRRQSLEIPRHGTFGPSALCRSASQNDGNPVGGSNPTVMGISPCGPSTSSRAVSWSTGRQIHIGPFLPRRGEPERLAPECDERPLVEGWPGVDGRPHLHRTATPYKRIQPEAKREQSSADPDVVDELVSEPVIQICSGILGNPGRRMVATVSMWAGPAASATVRNRATGAGSTPMSDGRLKAFDMAQT
jgi:hypothetical protein